MFAFVGIIIVEGARLACWFTACLRNAFLELTS
jgi:hypothetical protein